MFLDTNVLVYAYDDSEPAKRDRARQILSDDTIDLVISSQVLGEFYITMTRKVHPPLTEPEAADLVDQLADLHVVPITRNVVGDATRTSVESKVSYWDALILAAASAGGAGTLATEDLSDGSTILGVNIVNPFSSLHS